MSDWDLPAFFIIGSMKAGTTSLYEALSSTPGLVSVRPKEPAALLKTQDEAISIYRSLTRQANGARFGDGSTKYCSPAAAKAVRHYRAIRGDRPRPTVLWCVRDPVDRMVSHFCHDWAMGRAPSFDELGSTATDYFLLSDYSVVLRPWLEEFGDEIVPVRVGRDGIASNRESVRFPGVDEPVRFDTLEVPHLNRTAGRRPLVPAIRAVAASPRARALTRTLGIEPLARRASGASLLRRKPSTPSSDEVLERVPEPIQDHLRESAAQVAAELSCESLLLPQ
jgi:hypothetical protein